MKDERNVDMEELECDKQMVNEFAKSLFEFTKNGLDLNRRPRATKNAL